MGKGLIRDIVFGIFILLFQALVFNHMNITDYLIIPFVFLTIILLLPIEIPKWALLVIAFIVGLVLGIFSDTGGIYSASTVFMAFLRPFVLNSISSYDGYEVGTLPRIGYLGWIWKIKYTFILSFAFNFAFYLYDNFSFFGLKEVFIKVILGTIYTGISIILLEWAFFRK